MSGKRACTPKIMSAFQSSFNGHSALLWLTLCVAFVALGLWTVSVHARTARLEAHLDDLFGEASSENVARLLAEYLGTVRSTAVAVDTMRREHQEIANLMPRVVQHVGLVRFSPFHDTGGDQSFALAVLDGRRDGIVITGLHSRNDSRLYAKPVHRGESSYSLTPEEQQAMSQAIGNTPEAQRA